MDSVNYRFKNERLFKTALTHSSYANEHKSCGLESYERLEFLGDAVLDAVISEKLYKRYPNISEGELTKFRAGLVCEPSLAKKAAAISLNKHIRMGRGELQSGGAEKASILSDVFEAVVGAVFLDGGYDAVCEYIMTFFEEELSSDKVRTTTPDAKSYLQEVLQRTGTEIVTYRIASSEGPDHDKIFNVEAVYGGRVIGSGSGKSKKEAEQSAAAAAVALLKL